ncbi:MAG: hypothetical protein Q9221_006663 [Calogaya cf. arnoldii]
MPFNIDTLLSILSLESLSLWKVLAIFFALLNLKQLPFVWHIRIINGLIQYLPWRQYLSSAFRQTPHVEPRSIGPSALFRPLIFTTRTTLLECDYNLHKSNSTYFSDFDVGRMHLIICLFGAGIAKTGNELWKGDGRNGPKRLAVMMGGVNINFRKEIMPGQAYEMWSRVLCWDRKWIYTVTYFVRKGVVKPKGWLLQPWRNDDKMQTRTQMQDISDRKKEEDVSADGMKNEKGKTGIGIHPAIFATGIAKYVAKRGRLTIPPELIIQNSGLLPPKPKDHQTPPVSETPAVPVEGDALPNSGPVPSSGTAGPAPIVTRDMSSENATQVIDEALNENAARGDRDEGGAWDWNRIEKERLRGMEIAKKWNLTERLGEMFEGEEGMALGRWWDIP